LSTRNRGEFLVLTLHSPPSQATIAKRREKRDTNVTLSGLDPHNRRVLLEERRPLVMRFAFGPFQIDAVRKELFLNGVHLDLHHKASFGALLVLVQNKGQLVAKGRLMDSVWGQAAVEERSLNFAISVLRKALDPRLQGALGRENSCIETVHRRGFRFTVPVREVSDNNSACSLQ
jgi:DNA-binding winged helix-turn-helix (wHTH) protein